ncbi:MAG: double-strand break repair protein AddB [Pseudomonadota bacterium]
MSAAQRSRGAFSYASPRFFSIDPGQNFLHAFARGLHDALSDGPFDLVDAKIYLPTRRAARALTEAFFETAPSQAASLLPSVYTLGDIDEDEPAAFAARTAAETQLAPAISHVERRLILAKLIAARDRAYQGQARWAAALSAAQELAKLIDELHTDEIDPAMLVALPPENLAAHWRQSVDFLSIVMEAWPAHLAAIGRLDPAARRVALIDRLAAQWRAEPPAHPVILAGSTGSTPAVARLMKTAAAMPLGCVVLPGLDQSLPQEMWSRVDEPHPQSGLKALLEDVDVQRAQVHPWPAQQPLQKIQQRVAVTTAALRPAGASHSWRDWAAAAKAAPDALKAALDGVSLVEAADEEEEAAVIALAMRGALEAPSRTIALVTPDRNLARRAALKLRRWGLEVDDSAGAPLSGAARGGFLRLAAAWLTKPNDAASAISLMRHPLFGGGLDEKTRRQSVDAIDLALRGLAPKSGFEGLRARVSASAHHGARAEPGLIALQNAHDIWSGKDATLRARISAHIAASEALADTPERSGRARLWAGDDGEAAALAIEAVIDASAQFDDIPAGDYASVFDALIADVVVRTRGRAHPRLSIWGPLEARLQHADFMVLGGLNEGVWPREADADPFLSRAMRDQLGLPSGQRRIGLSAHDFSMLAASSSVMMTRACRAGGRPTTPSRWLVRLKNMLSGADALDQLNETGQWCAWARALDAPEMRVEIPAPRPAPPLDARPTAFYVTRIEKLLRDPYAVYARDILKLRKLDGVNLEAEPRHIGELFHAIFYEFAQSKMSGDDASLIESLEALFDKYAPDYGLDESKRPFWRARNTRTFERLIDWERARRALGAPSVLEGEGRWDFTIDGAQYALSARADRIDRLTSGGAFVVDYKTGGPPTQKQVETFSPQLPLTALIAEAGGFEALGRAPVEGFEYFHVLSPDERRAQIGFAEDKAAALIANAKDALTELLRVFADPKTPYLSQPRPQFVDQYGEYDHLARRRERQAYGGEA